MQPPVHLAVGYVCYSAYAGRNRGAPPAEAPILVALVGAALPDLIDKPLVAAGAVPVGRSVGHSLLFVVPLALGIWLLARRRDLGVAFAVGSLSHVAADVPWHVLAGDLHELGFLAWPLTEMPAYSGVKPLGSVPGVGVEATTLWLEAVVVVAALARWWIDGRPGLPSPRRRRDDGR